MLKRFRDTFDYELPEPVGWFLSNVVNGGYCSCDIEIPLAGEGGEAAYCLQGCYGLNHTDPDLDMVRHMLDLPERATLGLPIAFDDGGGGTMYMRGGERDGQVWHAFWDGFPDEPDYPEMYFVANDMREYGALIERLMNEAAARADA